MSSSSAGIEMGWWSNNSGGSSGSSSPSTSGWWAGSSSSPAAPAPSPPGGGWLGAGGVAKAGQILEKAGAISATSKLARAGKSIDLTVPDFAKAAGQKGEDIVVKRSSTNPLIKARQQAVNAGLKKLPENTPVVG